MEEEDIVTRQDGSMLVEASMNVDDFMEEMGILSYDDLKEEDFTTLSGLAMFLIGRVPKAGDLFSYKNLQFEVVDMDRGRVDKRGLLLQTASCLFVKRKQDGLTAETPPNRLPPKSSGVGFDFPYAISIHLLSNYRIFLEYPINEHIIPHLLIIVHVSLVL